MTLINYTLTEKNKLTDDIYEITFETQQDFDFIHGQFITFILPGFGGRAYSVVKKEKNKYILIIKKWELDFGGRGGSKFICEQGVGTQLQGVKPAGHFILKNNNHNKVFLGTGTGFAPLYNQILGSLEQKQDGQLSLIFGVREEKDLFYVAQLKELTKKYSNFKYHIYLSKENIGSYNHGYVTEYLNKDTMSNAYEYYICGAPAMITSCIEKLESNGIKKEHIHTEKY